jgi:hypothetical protein
MMKWHKTPREEKMAHANVGIDLQSQSNTVCAIEFIAGLG